MRSGLVELEWGFRHMEYTIYFCKSEHSELHFLLRGLAFDQTSELVVFLCKKAGMLASNTVTQVNRSLLKLKLVHSLPRRVIIQL